MKKITLELKEYKFVPLNNNLTSFIEEQRLNEKKRAIALENKETIKNGLLIPRAQELMSALNETFFDIGFGVESSDSGSYINIDLGMRKKWPNYQKGWTLMQTRFRFVVEVDCYKNNELDIWEYGTEISIKYCGESGDRSLSFRFVESKSIGEFMAESGEYIKAYILQYNKYNRR